MELPLLVLQAWALRAAEPEPFGMIGIGEIFRMYRDERSNHIMCCLMCDPTTNMAFSREKHPITSGMGFTDFFEQ